MTAPCLLRNGQAVPVADVPVLALSEFQRSILEGVGASWRVLALFGRPAGAGPRLYSVLGSGETGQLTILATELWGDKYPSLTPSCPQVNWFERELAENLGLLLEGHPRPEPIRSDPGEDAFFKVTGDDVHEVAVGPIHAAIIEPGHFRFQCLGERVLHLEIRLGYQHRGIERALIGGPDKLTVHRIETAAGDTTVGHGLAHAQLIEALAGLDVPVRAHAIRALALELERLANHVGDLGALAGDVGFLPTAAYCGRLRGEFLNMTALVCGSRFGRGWIQPGGTRFDLDADQIADLSGRLEAVHRDLAQAVELLFASSSVLARFAPAGRLSRDKCLELGLVGPPARGCGIMRDVRLEFPLGLFKTSQIPVSTWHSGGVFARAHVRWLEAQRSLSFVRDLLAGLAEDPIRTATAPQESARTPRMVANQLAVSLVEGWRGEICHVAETDSTGRFKTYKIVDPSFHNWMGLAVAMKDQAISDFPLCNKSFNLSYCGHDL